jgi:4-hydroxy-2-oxoheptanedioate aldolase
MFKKNALKTKLLAGEQLFGVWIETGSVINAEILAQTGFDFLLIDLEHGQGDIRECIDILRAVDSTGVPCVVRVPSNDPVFLKRILDGGVQSIMVPQVSTAQEAAAAVRACHYPPQGRRGYAAPIVRASQYGAKADYMARANDEILLIVQLESAEALEHASEICAVNGVDVPFLGVNDMAGSIGRLEQLDHPDVRSLVAKAETAMRASGKPLGTVASAGATWESLVDSGYAFVPVANDVSLLRDAAIATVAAQRSFRGASRKTTKPARY